jgi:type I restriction enzyme S subunit
MIESMKSDWYTYRLDELCTFHNGLWEGKTPPYVKVGVIRNTNFTKDGVIDTTDIPTLDVEVKQYKTRKLQHGDIILEKSGGGPKQPVGRVVVFDIDNGEYSLSNFTSAIRVKDTNKVTYEYLHRFLHFFYLSGKTESMQSHSTGIRNLDFARYKSIEVPLPSMQEQKRIVSILDDVFKDADNVLKISKNNLEKTKSIFDSILESIFNNPGNNWVETNLGSVAKIKGGKRVPRGYQMLSERTNHPYIRVSDFNEYGSVNMNDLKYIDENIYDQIKNYTITDKDMYISIAGTIGKSGIVPSELNGSNLTENASKLVFEKDIYNKYVYFFTRSKSFIEQAGLNTRTTAMPKLALSRLSSIRLKIPKSYTEQVAISTKMGEINEEVLKLNEIYLQKINYTKLLKQSVLNKAFRGEL